MTNIVSGTNHKVATATEEALKRPEVLRSGAVSLRFMPLAYRLKEAEIAGVIGVESVTHMLSISEELDQVQMHKDLNALIFTINKANQEPRNVEPTDIRAAWIEVDEAGLVQTLRALDFFSLCVIENADLTQTTIMIKTFV